MIDYTKEITETETAVQSMAANAMSDRDGWLAERKKGIGGSDVAAIIGASPWTTYAALWAEKTGVWPARDISGSPSVRFGVENEENVAKLFEGHAGKRVYSTGHFHRKDTPWMLASPDRLVHGEAAGLECKTTSSSYAYEWGEGNIPDAYYCQVQWYMAVMGFPVWYIACLFRDTGRFIYRRIERNDAFIAYMEQKASRFWGLVTTGTFPPDDGSRDWQKLLEEEFGCKPGVSARLGKDIAALCEETVKIDIEIERLKARRQEALNQIDAAMAGAETAVAGRYFVQRKAGRGKSNYKVLSVGKRDWAQGALFTDNDNMPQNAPKPFITNSCTLDDPCIASDKKTRQEQNTDVFGAFTDKEVLGLPGLSPGNVFSIMAKDTQYGGAFAAKLLRDGYPEGKDKSEVDMKVIGTLCYWLYRFGVSEIVRVFEKSALWTDERIEKKTAHYVEQSVEKAYHNTKKFFPGVNYKALSRKEHEKLRCWMEQKAAPVRQGV